MGWETHGVCVKSDGERPREMRITGGPLREHYAVGLFEKMPGTFIYSYAVHF